MELHQEEQEKNILIIFILLIQMEMRYHTTLIGEITQMVDGQDYYHLEKIIIYHIYGVKKGIT